MALPPSTANWHWKNKNVTKWGHTWFERELLNLTVKGDKDGEELTITKIVEVDGDVELGQRKSKLITIYDCKVVLEWAGKASDGTECKGRLDIPEVSHEITLDKLNEYQYYWSISSPSSAAAESLVAMAKVRGPPILEEVFARFPVALIETHGKDLTVSADPSRAATPAPVSGAATPSAAASSSVASPAPAAPAPKKEEKATNTTTVTVEASFMASADDLFGMLTDEKKIPMWTRASAQSAAKPDTEFSLFGGGVKGKYVSLEPPSKIVQTWALQSPTWPSGHTGTLTTTIEQSTDSTKVTLSLAGVPLGEQEEIKRNLEAYYIHGLKSIGYVQLFPSPPSLPSASSSKRSVRGTKKTPPKDGSSSSSYFAVGILTALILVAAFSIPYFSFDAPGRHA